MSLSDIKTNKPEILKNIAQTCIKDQRLKGAESGGDMVANIIKDAFNTYLTEYPDVGSEQFIQELAQELIPHCDEGLCYFFLCQMLVSIYRAKTGDVQ